jgi:hypothetical protein
MSEDLLNLVNEELMVALAPLDFRVVSSEVADVFDNATVVLEAPALRIRVLRERSIVVLDIGPAFEPNTWFDSAVVMDYLGLSTDAGFHDRDARGVLRGAGAFLTSMWKELTTKFERHQFTNTKKELSSLREDRALRLFGS